jgi:hypothetical protein
VAAILGFFLNFTIFIPVSSANQRNNKFNDEIVQYISSTNFNKIVKETPRKKIRFSKKKARKLKQLNEQRLRIILLINFIALKPIFIFLKNCFLFLSFNFWLVKIVNTRI